VTLKNAKRKKARFEVPADSEGNTFHIILTVRDNGSPNLFAYRRVIVEAP
jgi:hypothetical protein